MSIAFWPPWLDDDEAWRGLFSDSALVPADRADRARAFNVMILHILRNKVPEKIYLAARGRVIEIAGNWLKSGEGIPEVLLPEIEGARYEENLASLKRQRFAVLEVQSAPVQQAPKKKGWFDRLIDGLRRSS